MLSHGAGEGLLDDWIGWVWCYTGSVRSTSDAPACFNASSQAFSVLVAGSPFFTNIPILGQA